MKKLLVFILCFGLFSFLTSESSCNAPIAQSASGVQKATIVVHPDLNGKTIEQNNIINRLAQDNMPGSIKHLYVISSMSGQVLIYSTVKGKVTSSDKRLSPSSITALSTDGGNSNTEDNSFAFDLGNGLTGYTQEMMGDDGTYGHSAEYIYWFDSKSVYHQLYITGGEIVTISNEPMACKSIVMNFETNTSN